MVSFGFVFSPSQLNRQMAQIELGSRLIIGVVLFLLDPSRPILSTLIAIVLPRLVVVVAVVGDQNFAGSTPNKRRHSNGQEQRPTAQDFLCAVPQVVIFGAATWPPSHHNRPQQQQQDECSRSMRSDGEST
jgi:hypothetical protein